MKQKENVLKVARFCVCFVGAKNLAEVAVWAVSAAWAVLLPSTLDSSA